MPQQQVDRIAGRVRHTQRVGQRLELGAITIEDIRGQGAHIGHQRTGPYGYREFIVGAVRLGEVVEVSHRSLNSCALAVAPSMQVPNQGVGQKPGFLVLHKPYSIV